MRRFLSGFLPALRMQQRRPQQRRKPAEARQQRHRLTQRSAIANSVGTAYQQARQVEMLARPKCARSPWTIVAPVALRSRLYVAAAPDAVVMPRESRIESASVCYDKSQVHRTVSFNFRLYFWLRINKSLSEPLVNSQLIERHLNSAIR